MKAETLSALSRWIIDSLFLPRIELGTLRVWGARDNHYTTETNWYKIKKQRQNSGEEHRYNKKFETNSLEMQVLARFQLGFLPC